MKKLLLILLCLPLLFTSCKKEITDGCTESLAVNYNSDAEEDDGSCLFSVIGGIWNVYNIEYFLNDSLTYSGPPLEYPAPVSLQFYDNFGLLGQIQPDSTTQIDTIHGWFIENDSLYVGADVFKYIVSKNELKLEGKFFSGFSVDFKSIIKAIR
ncbi:MAG: hypothetical protein CMD16_00725 [Flavobacteriales bacterium]|nr:hypothetical protein [Flavobacteriales bacterium]|tara:strand:- start:971 stop:1432 length:462 start_codon:yes stop_codon:yes gene_type:complete